ncbi:MAG: transglycosylase SLT domain-containing protein [Paracoccaceae bacterium]
MWVLLAAFVIAASTSWAGPAAAALEAPVPAAKPASPPPPNPDAPKPENLAEAEGPGIERICTLIESAAARHGLIPDFFARLIWKESRFDVKAISPVGAQGIAQFMPGTAKERGLADPWDPDQAIPASAHYLADLRAQFGNWGLAAAAYNGGPSRVERFLDRGFGLPLETVNYVHSITYRPVEWFRERGRDVEPRPLDPKRSFGEACRDLPVLPTRAVSAGVRAPWGVQIAGGRNRSAALRAANRVVGRYASVIGGKSVMVVRSRRGIRGTPYQARIGAASRREAGLLCARLKRAGGACVVLRN